MKIIVTEPHQVYYDDSVYSSFPDLIRTPDGELMAIFRMGDAHHPKESLLILARSNDGKSWTQEIFAQATLLDHGYVFNCPRINFVQNRYVIICDTKDSIYERQCKWAIFAWWSEDGKVWRGPQDLKVAGTVPDKIVVTKNSLIMGYHVCEIIKRQVTGSGIRKRFIQMMAESFDQGETWNDRTTIITHSKYNFCEGSIVQITDNRMLCYLRDNKGVSLRSHIVLSVDGGRTWGKPKKLSFCGHRIVAQVKKYEPYAGAIIGTFRNTANRTLSIFIHNPKSNKFQVLPIDTETHKSLFNYGYSGWAENPKDGSLQVIYYIQRDNPNPQINCVNIDIQ